MTVFNRDLGRGRWEFQSSGCGGRGAPPPLRWRPALACPLRPAPSLPTLPTQNGIQAQGQSACHASAQLLTGAQLMLRLEPCALGQQRPAPRLGVSLRVLVDAGLLLLFLPLAFALKSSAH